MLSRRLPVDQEERLDKQQGSEHPPLENLSSLLQKIMISYRCMLRLQMVAPKFTFLDFGRRGGLQK